MPYTPILPNALRAAEYCARGSLYDVLKQANRSPAAAAELTWRRRVDIAVGAARGLLYLHLSSPPILHCDVCWAGRAEWGWRDGMHPMWGGAGCCCTQPTVEVPAVTFRAQ